MLRKRVISLFWLGALGILLFYACTSEIEPLLNEDNLSIRVHWEPGQLLANEDELELGVSWTMSSLGGFVPPGSLASGLVHHGNNEYTLRFLEFGFSIQAQRAMERILTELKGSGEYLQNGRVPLGRVVMLMLNSSNHYYEITEMPKTLSEFRSLYRFEGIEVALTGSTIATSHRLLEVASAESYAQIAHIGSESGEDFRPNRPFTAREFETLDVMPNGNLRYAIYGPDGRLRPFADESLTIAGRPAKCMWCHESSIQPLFAADPALETDSTITAQEFLAIREVQLDLIATFREGLNTEHDYFNRRNHQFMEWIYEDFMEPNAEFLAAEWGLSLNEVNQRLAGLTPHMRAGVPGFYHRKDVDGLAPFDVLRVPDAAREASEFEPNYFE